MSDAACQQQQEENDIFNVSQFESGNHFISCYCHTANVKLISCHFLPHLPSLVAEINTEEEVKERLWRPNNQGKCTQSKCFLLIALWRQFTCTIQLGFMFLFILLSSEKTLKRI